MKTIILMLTTCFLLVLSTELKAQYKYEREYTIKADVVPEAALSFVDSIGVDSKLRWYREVGLDSESLEAKFKHHGKKYSVEFDTLGNLLDVEIVIAPSEMPEAALGKIELALDSLYSKWKFQKIQMQYIGDPEEVLTSIHKNEASANVKMSYEIVLKGKKPGNTEEYEMTFNEMGELKNTKTIIQDAADHLEY